LVTIAAGPLRGVDVARGEGVMAVLLLILGIVVAASGVAAIGFGIPLNEFTLGTTLMSGGVTALTGGLILIGLSAVVSELGRLVDGLKRVSPRPPQRSGEVFEPAAPAVSVSPLPMPAAVSNPRPPPAPNLPLPPRARPEAPVRDARPAAPHQPSPSSVEVSAAAIERLRSTIPRTEAPRVEPPVAGYGEEAPLSPNGATAPSAPPPRTRAEPAMPEPRVTADERAGGAVDALKTSRLDFLFRSKPARPAQPESFDAIWPTDSRPERSSAPAPEPQPQPTPEQSERPSSIAPPMRDLPLGPAAAPEPPPAATILKSGVVDGMAYTLYTDGSIEARLPQGTIRFGSVAELRAHIESNS
jgi:hypothetical protein